MAGPFDTHCAFSQVKNVSGGRMVFGFLPPHGRELQANETYTVFGNIFDAVAGKDGGDRVTSRRHIRAFEAALSRGDMQVISTPSPVLLDATTGASKMLRLNNTTLGTVDPCWLTAGSVVDPEGGRDYTG